MSSKENERHLKRILYREAFERRRASGDDTAERADARAALGSDGISRWLKARARIEHVIGNLRRRLAAVGVDVREDQARPHAYTQHEYPSIGRLRLVLFENHLPTTKTLEFDVSENALVHLYLYLPTGTRRSDIDLDDLDEERIEAVLLDFIDVATREHPSHCP